MRKLSNEAEFLEYINSHAICLVYFSGPDCAVCKVLKPKLVERLRQDFKKVEVAEIDCSQLKALAAQQTVFSLPTVIVFIEGRENSRKSRSFSLSELASELQRPYSVLYGS